MKIATLEYIHKLIEDDVCTKKLRYQKASNDYTEAVDRSQTNAERLEDYAEGLYDIYIRAVTALNDFEDEDF